MFRIGSLIVLNEADDSEIPEPKGIDDIDEDKKKKKKKDGSEDEELDDENSEETNTDNSTDDIASDDTGMDTDMDSDGMDDGDSDMGDSDNMDDGTGDTDMDSDGMDDGDSDMGDTGMDDGTGDTDMDSDGMDDEPAEEEEPVDITERKAFYMKLGRRILNIIEQLKDTGTKMRERSDKTDECLEQINRLEISLTYYLLHKASSDEIDNFIDIIKKSKNILNKVIVIMDKDSSEDKKDKKKSK